MHAEPQKEHRWLERLVGNWTFQGECQMGPDQPTSQFAGTETVRSLGGLWTIGEGEGEMPDGGAATSIMTLGYSPPRGRFVGTFVASMMTHLWLYDGALDADGKILTLDTEGPADCGEGSETKMAAFQDIIEWISDDHRTLTSRMRGDDGRWQTIMTAHYRRKA